MVNSRFKKIILEATGASDLFEIQKIQNLWSGYGAIVRYGLLNASVQSVVVKHVRLPKNDSHPRGWNTDRSHQRKIKSYGVETAWYQNWSSLCGSDCYVPDCLAVDSQDDETLIVLQDLADAGFSEKKTSVSLGEVKVCLSWLACFHATYMGLSSSDLWENGTYWHLETRPDELAALDDEPLKKAAQKIDQKLKETPYQTFVHGDAKLANFCFSKEGQVAAVDFQYVGGGCGMKDVAYFIGSCLSEDDCERYEKELLNHYFGVLKKFLKNKNKSIDCAALETDWRRLFPVAWTDFHRFIKGWSPEHWKINSYSERLARDVLRSL